MALIRSQKFHLWIQANAQLIEKLRLDYVQTTGKEIDFDSYVEMYYHKSKALEQPLPTRAELLYMYWLAQNRTLLGKGHATQLKEPLTPKDINTFNYDMYLKTQMGELDLSDFIN